MAFLYKREVSVDNTGLGSTLTAYQVLVELDNTNFDFTHAQTNGEDLRFYADEARTTPLDHWILSYDSVGETAVIWVEVDSIAASSTETIWLFYGDNALADASDITTTFLAGFDPDRYHRAFEFASKPSAMHDSFKIGSDIYVSGRKGNSDLVLHKSTDDGVTWTEDLSVPWAAATGRDHCTTDTDGVSKVYAAAQNSGRTAVVHKKSTDSGATFGGDATVASGLTGVADPKILYVSSSLLLCFFKRDGASTTDVIECYSSADDGASWASLSTVVSEAATSGIEDMDAIVDGNGHIRICWENETTDKGASALKEAVSTDNGATWGSPTTIVAVSGSIDTEGAHYLLDGSNNLSIIYPSNANQSSLRSYDYNQVLKRDWNGSAWSAASVFWEGNGNVESVGEYTSDGKILLVVRKHHDDATSIQAVIALKAGVSEQDFSDDGWTQDQGTAWVRVDPADSANNVLRVDGYPSSADEGYFTHSHSGGDYIIEGRIRSEAPSVANMRLVFAFGSVSNHYMLLFSSNVFFFKVVSGTATQLAAASPSFAASLNTWYTYKIQVSGSSPTTVKIWLDSGATASTLRINTTDSTYSSGKTGMRQNAPNSGTTDRMPVLHDDFRVRKFAATEPSVTVGSEESAAAAKLLLQMLHHDHYAGGVL